MFSSHHLIQIRSHEEEAVHVVVHVVAHVVVHVVVHVVAQQLLAVNDADRMMPMRHRQKPKLIKMMLTNRMTLLLLMTR
jgi:phosphosulfolactate phosphohydrolase-like enzyme